MSSDALPSYALVSPVRDEAADFARTAESVIAQSHRPLRWVIVDDGSTDGTKDIAQRYADRHDWIDLVDSGGRHERARGAPIVRAFNAGRERLSQRPDITVKLDGDLFLPAHYFAWVATVFRDDPRAGVVGGVALIHDGDHWRADPGKQMAVNGVAKAYRTDCLDEIGGLPASMGWDGIDEFAARARGWHVHVLTELHLLHYKQRGAKQAWWRARIEEGRGNHFMGYLPTFLAVRALYRMLVERPPVLGGLLLACGYAHAAVSGAPRFDDVKARAMLQAEQRARLRALAGGRLRLHPRPVPGGGPAFTATGGPTAGDAPRVTS